jgi:hypothetical protein
MQQRIEKQNGETPRSLRFGVVFAIDINRLAGSTSKAINSTAAQMSRTRLIKS